MARERNLKKMLQKQLIIPFYEEDYYLLSEQARLVALARHYGFDDDHYIC